MQWICMQLRLSIIVNTPICHYRKKPLLIINSSHQRALVHFVTPSVLCFQRTPPIKEDSWRHRRLANELRQLNCDPPEGIYASPLDDKCSHWQAIITGPKGSPYEDGIFYLYLKIPSR